MWAVEQRQIEDCVVAAKACLRAKDKQGYASLENARGLHLPRDLLGRRRVPIEAKTAIREANRGD